MGPWVNDYGPCGLAVFFCALVAPVLLGLGGGMLGVHRPHTLIASEGTLYAVQIDYWDELFTPETYSYCIYSFAGQCADGTVVNATARRDDLAYSHVRALRNRNIKKPCLTFSGFQIRNGAFRWWQS